MCSNITFERALRLSNTFPSFKSRLESRGDWGLVVAVESAQEYEEFKNLKALIYGLWLSMIHGFY